VEHVRLCWSTSRWGPGAYSTTQGRVRRGGPGLGRPNRFGFRGPRGRPAPHECFWPQEFSKRRPVGKRSAAVGRGLGPELVPSAHSEARVAQRKRVVRQRARRFRGAGCFTRHSRSAAGQDLAEVHAGCRLGGGPASGVATRALPRPHPPQQLDSLALSRPTPQKSGAAVQSAACTDTPPGSPSTRARGPCLRRIGVWLTGGVVAGPSQTSTGRFFRSPLHGSTTRLSGNPRLRAG